MNALQKKTRGDQLVLLAALIWGIAFYFQKTAMSHIGPLLFVGLRSAVAAVALVPFAVREQRRPGVAAVKVVPIAALGGIVFLIAGSIQQFGIVTATVINTGLLTALYVVATPFAFWAIERQSPPGVAWLGAGIAFLGVWGLSGGSLGALSDGDWLVALATVGWGIHIVVTGKSSKLARPITYTCIQFTVVAGVALSLAATFESVAAPAIFSAIDSILYVGLLSTALTFGIMAVALQHIPAPRASVMLSTEIFFSAAAGYVLLGERLTLLGWCGAALILTAILIVRSRE